MNPEPSLMNALGKHLKKNDLNTLNLLNKSWHAAVQHIISPEKENHQAVWWLLQFVYPIIKNRHLYIYIRSDFQNPQTSNQLYDCFIFKVAQTPSEHFHSTGDEDEERSSSYFNYLIEKVPFDKLVQESLFLPTKMKILILIYLYQTVSYLFIIEPKGIIVTDSVISKTIETNANLTEQAKKCKDELEKFLNQLIPSLDSSQQSLVKAALATPHDNVPKTSNHGGKKTLDKLTVKELQQRCAKRKIKYSGLCKAELIAALRRR